MAAAASPSNHGIDPVHGQAQAADVKTPLLDRVGDDTLTLSDVKPTAKSLARRYLDLPPHKKILLLAIAIPLFGVVSEAGYAEMMKDGNLDMLQIIYEHFVETCSEQARYYLEWISSVIAYGDAAAISAMIMNLPGVAKGIVDMIEKYRSAPTGHRGLMVTMLALCSTSYVFGSLSPVIGYAGIARAGLRLTAQIHGFIGQMVVYIAQAGSNPVKLLELFTKGGSVLNRFVLPALVLGLLSSTVRAGVFTYSGYELPGSLVSGYSNELISTLLAVPAFVSAFAMNLGTVGYNSIQAAGKSQTRYQTLEAKHLEDAEKAELVEIRRRAQGAAESGTAMIAVTDLNRFITLTDKQRTPEEESEFQKLSSVFEQFRAPFRLGIPSGKIDPTKADTLNQDGEGHWVLGAPATKCEKFTGLGLSALSFTSRTLGVAGFAYYLLGVDPTPAITAGLTLATGAAYAQFYNFTAAGAAKGVAYMKERVITGAATATSALATTWRNHCCHSSDTSYMPMDEVPASLKDASQRRSAQLKAGDAAAVVAVAPPGGR